jgi:DNA-binding CsgD family transcriptional regulator
MEKTVVHCLAQGMQSKEIAAHVGRSKPTVEGYIRLLFAKTNARSRAQLVAIANGMDPLSGN